MTPTHPPRRARDDRGAVLTLVAILLPVLLVMTAFAVDLGRQRSIRRTMQARADIIALDMVRLADGRTETEILSAGDYTSYLSGSASRNEAIDLLNAGDLVVDYGTWTEASGFIPTASAGRPDAVRVTADDEIDYFFKPGTGKASRSATASAGAPEAGFTIGSFAARISTSGDTVLGLAGELLDMDTTTTLVGFNGLANSTLKLGDLLTALEIGSPDQIAGTSVSMHQFAVAAATVLHRSSAPTDLANAALLDRIVQAGLPSRSVDMGQVLKVVPGGDGAALDSDLNALDLLLAHAQLSNGTSGFELDNLTLNLANLGGTGIGLGTVQSDLDIIQPPQPVFGPVNTEGRTDQVKTHIEAKLLGGPLEGLANAAITIDLGTATGTGRITAINCANPQTFDVFATAGLLETDIAIKITLLGIPVTIFLEKGPSTKTATQRFTRQDDPLNPDPAVFTPDPREIGNGQIGLAGITPRIEFGLPLGLLAGLVNSLLAPLLTIVTGTLLPVLDNALLGPLAAQLGLNVGGADLRPTNVECTNSARLVG